MTTTQPATGGTTLPDTIVHGTLTAYTNHQCRCAKCTARATAWSAKRRRQLAYGRWQPNIDASLVRAHIQTLRDASMTRKAIALRSGLTEARLKQIISDGYTTIRTADAQQILAVTPPTAPAPSLLTTDATATRRRLQALSTLGWPLPHIARTAGLTGIRNLYDVIHGRQHAVTTHTAHAINEAYDQLWDQDPAAHGVPLRLATRLKGLAARRLWAPPMAWDDDTIGDPAATPDWTARCGTPGGYYDHTQIGTPTCQRCRDAVAQAAAERKLRRRNRAVA